MLAKAGAAGDARQGASPQAARPCMRPVLGRWGMKLPRVHPPYFLLARRPKRMGWVLRASTNEQQGKLRYEKLVELVG